MKLLPDNGYSLDVKLHPIFRSVDLSLDYDDRLVHFVDEVEEGEYSLFITDFSSYLFDFLYMNIPVLSFIPDWDEFRCGMNGYRNVDFLDKVDNEEVFKSADGIIKGIQKWFLTGKGMDYSVEFFNNGDFSSKDEIYKCILEA